MIPAIPQLLSLNPNSNPELGFGTRPAVGEKVTAEDTQLHEFKPEFEGLVASAIQTPAAGSVSPKPALPIDQAFGQKAEPHQPTGSDLPVSGKDMPTEKVAVRLSLRETTALTRVSEPADAEPQADQPSLEPLPVDGEDRNQTLAKPKPDKISMSPLTSPTEAADVPLPATGEETGTEPKIVRLEGRASPQVESAKPREFEDLPIEVQSRPVAEDSAATESEAIPQQPTPDADQPLAPMEAAQVEQPVAKPPLAEVRPGAAPILPIHHRADQTIRPGMRFTEMRQPLTEPEPKMPPKTDIPSVLKAPIDERPSLGPRVEAKSPSSSTPGSLINPTALEPAQSVQSQAVTSPAPTAITSTVSTPLNLPTSQIAEARVEARMIPQIEQAIDALSDAREAGRVSRPEMTFRHGEFGVVNMRLEAVSGDLRATLSSRDPGFVPAVQAAMVERAASASGETSTNANSQRGQEHNSGGAAGSGGGNAANYGSSPGSSQGSSQPRLAQQELAQQKADSGNREETGRIPPLEVGASGLFA